MAKDNLAEDLQGPVVDLVADLEGQANQGSNLGDSRHKGPLASKEDLALKEALVSKASALKELVSKEQDRQRLKATANSSAATLPRANFNAVTNAKILC